MARTRSHRPSRAEAPAAEAAPGANGAPEKTADRPTVQRAEEMVDRLGEKIGYYASLFGRQVLRLAGRAREEAEDIWAEAQNLRRGGRSRGSGSSGTEEDASAGSVPGR